ncbi:MAG: DNA polymerase III subunit gamma/tau, partial [Clostridia bacterium]
MSYLALYRKFRPTTFDEVVGQEHISTTLRNQITQGRISHAYLFCGSRGTGKTSLAKLFAKAVNCENPIDGNPCGKCPTCLALSQPDNMDIIEIDAASNNSVDDLRDLRDKVQFQPVSAKYKVYIIDEVHMLTINAFNALLKTLEEPPKHVIFILATTEVHKIPATILSRCMRFDFKLISLEKIFSHIKFVYSQIGKEAEDEALYAIAKAGAGSMRDALSIAEICLSLTNGKLTFLQVNEIIGNLSRDKLESLFEAIVSKNQKEVLNFVDDYIKSGKSVSVITRDIFQFFRDILVLKVANADTLTLPKDVLDRMKTLAQKVDNSFLIRALDIFAELEPKYKLSQNPKILLEIALIKLTNLQSDLSISALARRVIALEAKLNELQTHREIQPVPMAKKTLEDELIEKLENTKPQTEQIPP